MQTDLDLETLVELVARVVVKVLNEQEPKIQPLGWQSSANAAKALGINKTTLISKKPLLKFNRDYRLVPGEKTRYQFHVENCKEKLRI